MEVQRLKISEQKRIEGNKIISVFMGLKIWYIDGNKINVEAAPEIIHPINEWAKYHSSWNWLMPIIKKLNGGRPHSAMLWEDITKALIDCDIERTWVAVVEYIKWFYKKTIE